MRKIRCKCGDEVILNSSQSYTTVIDGNKSRVWECESCGQRFYEYMQKYIHLNKTEE